jgi:hypothetical protein
MDTAEDKGESVGSDHIHLAVTPDQVSQILNDHQYNQRYRWLDPAVIRGAGAISDGAGAIRMIGKLGFLQHYVDFEQKVRDKITGLNQAQAGDVPQDFRANGPLGGRLKIYVVANLVSGTGSGSFIDVGFALRRFIHDLSGAFPDGLPQIDITGIFTLPDDLNDKVKASNAFHALVELNHYFSDDHNYQIDDMINPGGLTPNANQVVPFDFTYLLKPQGGVTNHEQMENVASEYIYNDIFSPSAAVRDGQRDNVRIHFRARDPLGFFPRLMTFGISTIAYPIEQIARACGSRLIVETLNYWYNLSGADTTRGERPWANLDWDGSVPVDTLVSLPSEVTKLGIGPGDYEMPNSLFHSLLSPTKLPGTEEEFDLVEEVTHLIDTTLRRYQGQNPVLHDLEVLIENMFHQHWKSGTGEQLPPGVVDKIIEINQTKLTEDLPQKINIAVLEMLFSANKGAPFLAKSLLSDHIQSVFKTGVADEEFDGGEDTKLAQIRADLADLEEDFILSSPADFFRGLVRRSLVKRYREALLDYFRARLLGRLGKAQKKMGEDLAPSLNILQQRLDNFNTYMVEGWRKHLIADYKKDLNHLPVNGYDLLNGQPESEIRRQYEISIKESNRTQKIASVINAWRKNQLTDTETEDTSLYNDLALSPAIHSCFDRGMQDLIDFDEKTKEKVYRRPHDHEADIVRPVRRNFYGVINQQDVLQRFLPAAKPETVRRVNESAKALLNVPPATQDSIPFDRQRMQMQWFFYPGGNQIVTTPPANPRTNVEKFASLLNQLGGINFQEQSQDAQDTQTILILRERAAFALHMLPDLPQLIAASQTRGLTSTYTMWEQQSIPNPLVSRVDVHFVPVTKKERELLKNADRVFLIAVAIDILVSHNGGFTISRTGTGDFWDEYRRYAQYQGNMQLSSNRTDAAFELYKHPKWVETLEKEFDSQRQQSGDVDFLRKIHQFIANPRQRGIYVDQATQLEMARYLLADYVRQDEALRRLWEATYPDIPLGGQHMAATYHEGNHDDNYPRSGFYCDHCGAWVPNSENFVHPDGSSDPGQLPAQCLNPFCGGGLRL